MTTKMRLLTVGRVAQICGVCEQTVRRRIEAGDLPAENVGGEGKSARWRMTIADVAEVFEVSKQAVRQKIWDGKIKAVNIGSEGKGAEYRIPVSELEKLTEDVQ